MTNKHNKQLIAERIAELNEIDLMDEDEDLREIVGQVRDLELAALTELYKSPSFVSKYENCEDMIKREMPDIYKQLDDLINSIPE
jgi:hypothetical protein